MGLLLIICVCVCVFGLSRDLGGEFPETPPRIQLENFQVFRHSHVQEDGTIHGFHGLRAHEWSPRMNVGSLVREILVHFKTNPPRRIVSQTHPTQIIPQVREEAPRKNNTVNIISLPKAPETYEEIEKLSIAEIQELLEDEALFESFINSLPALTNVKKLKHDLQLDVLKIAQFNLSLKEELLQLQKEASTFGEELQLECTRFDQLNEKRNATLSVCLSYFLFLLIFIRLICGSCSYFSNILCGILWISLLRNVLDLNQILKSYSKS